MPDQGERPPSFAGRTLFVMRWLGALVFALAAGSCVLASSGLAVPPHVDPPGTPLSHDHLLAAYRYPLFLPELRAASERAGEPGWSLETPAQVQLGALVLATLVVTVAALPRRTRSLFGRPQTVVLGPSQWRLGAPLGPPRTYLFVTI